MSSKLDRFLHRSARLGEEMATLRRKVLPAASDPAGDLWQPRLEVYHHQNDLFIDIELPGVPAAALEVETHPNLVVVRGHKATLEDLADRAQVLSTREYGPFVSQIAIPGGYVLEGCEQRLENGVLHLKFGISPRLVEHAPQA